MADHTITLSDNAEAGLVAEAQRRTDYNAINNPDLPAVTADDVLALETEALASNYQTAATDAAADAVRDAYLSDPSVAEAINTAIVNTRPVPLPPVHI